MVVIVVVGDVVNVVVADDVNVVDDVSHCCHST